MKIDIVQTSFVTVVNFTLSGESKDLTLKTFNTVDDSTAKFMDHLQLLHRNTQSPDPRDAYALFNEIQTAGQTDELEDVEEISEECEQESTAPAPASSVVTEDLTPGKEVSCGCANHMEKRSVNTIIPIDCALAFDLMFGPKCPVQHAVQIRRKNKSNTALWFIK